MVNIVTIARAGIDMLSGKPDLWEFPTGTAPAVAILHHPCDREALPKQHIVQGMLTWLGCHDRQCCQLAYMQNINCEC